MKYELNKALDRELIESHEHLHESFSHEHCHDPKEKKRQINRLARIIGHLQKVKQMLEDDEDCADVLLQLSASKSALNGLGKEIINDHLSHCIIHAVEDGDDTALNEFMDAIQKFV
ncbi:MAG: metal-sensing transcriptional repressor [Lachnospiraceae bacterium]|nr:metal-sensing transcriptional repressor [Lachnospiraceae bacterium]